MEVTPIKYLLEADWFKLSAIHRTVLELANQSLPYKDIATKTGYLTPTIRWLVARLRHRFRKGPPAPKQLKSLPRKKTRKKSHTEAPDSFTPARTPREWFERNYMYLITVVEDYIGRGVCRSFVMDVVHDFVLENYNNQDILAYRIEVILKKLVDKYWNLVFGYNILVPHSRRLYPPKDNDGVRADDFWFCRFEDDAYTFVDNDIRLGSIDHNTYSGLDREDPVLMAKTELVDQGKFINGLKTRQSRSNVHHTQAELDRISSNWRASIRRRQKRGWNTTFKRDKTKRPDKRGRPHKVTHRLRFNKTS